MANKLTTLIFVFLSILNTSSAAIIVGYDFTFTTTATVVDSDVTSTDVSGQGGFSNATVDTSLGDTTGIAASGTTFGSTSLGSYGDTNENLDANNLSGAITDDAYISFIVTANTPGSLSISNFSVSVARENGKAAESYNILAQVNGSTSWTTMDAITIDQSTMTGDSNTDWDDTSVDLSVNTDFQDIDSVEFRIYFWGGNGKANGSRVSVDNILIEGNVVPEPSSLLLICISALALFARKRKL